MKSCVICNDAGRYKCPTCMVYYCSAFCCKKHRGTKCEVSEASGGVATTPQSDEYSKPAYPTEDTVSFEKLKSLEHNKDLKHLLENPHLKNLLKVIDSSDKPDEIMQKAMQEPLFVEFADACMAVVEPRDEDEVMR